MTPLSHYIEHIDLYPHSYRVEYEKISLALRCDPETAIILDCRFYTADLHTIDIYNNFSSWLIGQPAHSLTAIIPSQIKPIADILIPLIYAETQRTPPTSVKT